MSSRWRRLSADFERVGHEFSRHPNIALSVLEGDPAERYLVTYRVPSLVRDPRSGQPAVHPAHQVEIYLHAEYPRIKPTCTMRSEVFHPNIKGEICMGDDWAASSSLVDVVYQIGEMLMFQNYSYRSPLNGEAARWVLQNLAMFPLSSMNLREAEPEIALENAEDCEIELL